MRDTLQSLELYDFDCNRAVSHQAQTEKIVMPRKIIFSCTDPSILSPEIFDLQYVESIVFNFPKDISMAKEPLCFGAYQNLRKVEFFL